MRIFVQPRNGDSFDRTIGQAVEILQKANIPSAQAGGTINGSAVVLIDPEEIPEALATLERAEMRATVNECKRGSAPIPDRRDRSIHPMPYRIC